MSDAQAEALARQFHEAYERLAPSFGYKTREASAVPWDQVPEQNRALMVAVAAEILKQGIGKQPHSVKPNRWSPLPQPDKPEMYIPGTKPGPARHVVLGDPRTYIADAGTGGPC
ncbi:hypothetical protein [Amycolatopsis japonica]